MREKKNEKDVDKNVVICAIIMTIQRLTNSPLISV